VVCTEDPNRGRYRASSGCATSATQAGSSSGRVVSIHTGPVGEWNEIRWNAPATSRSSSSARAPAVWEVTSHSVRASARDASPRGQVRQKPALRPPPARVADRRVEQGPVDRQADPPPGLLEGPLVDGGEPLA